MGTSTIFRRLNDLGGRLASMSKEELEKIDSLSPWKQEIESVRGWNAPLELHNGNAHILVWWYGRLMRIEDAPKQLSRKYYHKYSGKTLNVYEWTVLRKYCQNLLKQLDKEFKRLKRKSKRGKKYEQ